jgi:hypothetical protein
MLRPPAREHSARWAPVPATKRRPARDAAALLSAHDAAPAVAVDEMPVLVQKREHRASTRSLRRSPDPRAGAHWQLAGANNAGRRTAVVYVGERPTSDAHETRVPAVVATIASLVSASVMLRADRDRPRGGSAPVWKTPLAGRTLWTAARSRSGFSTPNPAGARPTADRSYLAARRVARARRRG